MSVDAISLQDSDAEIILSDFTDDNFEEPQPKNIFKKAVKKTVTMSGPVLDLTGSTDVHVIVELVFDEGKQERVKKFYAKVVETSPDKHEVSVDKV